jgi:hypothetical protein
MGSPLGTPPTERAMKIADMGLSAAEALERDGQTSAAAELKAATLQEAALAYEAQSRRRAKKISPLASARKPLQNVGIGSPLANVVDLDESPSSAGEESEESVEERKLRVLARVAGVSFASFAVAPTQDDNDLTATSAASEASHCDAISTREVAADGQPLLATEQTMDGCLAAVATTDTQTDTQAESSHRVARVCGFSVCRDGDRPYTMYEIGTGEEHVAHRRYSEFVALDSTLRRILADRSFVASISRLGLLACVANELPPLPPKTIPLLQDATAPSVVSYRWGALQRYLDAANGLAEDHPQIRGAVEGFLRM